MRMRDRNRSAGLGNLYLGLERSRNVLSLHFPDDELAAAPLLRFRNS